MRNYNDINMAKLNGLLKQLETADENEAPKIILAFNLLRFRNERKQGGTETAQALGVDIKNYYQWERGEVVPSLRYLIALAQYYGVTVDGLLTLDGVLTYGHNEA